MNNILASSLADLLAAKPGLNYLSLPAKMPLSFIQDLIKQTNAEKNDQYYAHHVTRKDSSESITPNQAVKIRTRDDDTEAGALIVAWNGDFKDSKSLEVFQHLNPLSLPSGVADIDRSQIDINEISLNVAKRLADSLDKKNKYSDDVDVLKSALSTVLTFLGSAYRRLGNSEISWKDAWWLHVHFGCERISDLVKSTYYNANTRTLGWQVKLVFSAFCLPIPEDTKRGTYDEKNNAESFKQIIETKWKDADSAISGLLEMERVAKSKGRIKPDGHYLLKNISTSWEKQYNTTIAYEGHPILAFSKHGCASQDHILAWSHVYEADFFDQVNTDTEIELFKGIEGALARVPTIDDLASLTYIVACSLLELSEDKRQICFETLFLKIHISQYEFGLDEFLISSSPKNLKITILDTVSQDGENIWLKINICIDVTSKREGNWREKPYKVTLVPANRGSSQSGLTRALEFHLLIPMPGETNFYIIGKSKRKTKKVHKLIEIPERHYKLLEDDSIEILSADDNEGLQRSVLVNDEFSFADLVMSGPPDELIIDGDLKAQELYGNVDCGIMRHRDLVLLDNKTVEKNGEALVFRVIESGKRPFSPISASAVGEIPNSDEDGDFELELLKDPRGYLEKNWLHKYYRSGDEAVRDGVGQIIAFVDQGNSASEISYNKESGFYVLGDCCAPPSLPPEIRESQLLDDFWIAFDELGLASMANGLQGNTSCWPSRLMLKDIPKDKIDSYLSIYLELVKFAEKDSRFRFLLYPLSALMYQPDEGKFTGVMLSPLHPIRLTWAWSVQTSCNDTFNKLSDSIDVTKLLRFVDGFNFPSNGPMPKGGGNLVAVHLNSGIEDLFVTWSYLADIDMVNAKSPHPETLSGLVFPIGTLSGIDRGGVAAAINDYLRAYPYVSELRLGLYSQKKRPRSEELDRAIYAELKTLLPKWSGELKGGIKVYDSPNRQGCLPSKDKILASVSNAVQALNIENENSIDSFPFEWRVDSKDSVDIRFLEDTLVDVNHDSNSGEVEGTGIMPQLPLSRHHAWVNESGGIPSSSFNPLLNDDQKCDFPIFVEALKSIETIGGIFKTTCFVPDGAALRDDNADWIVAGNTNLDVSLLSKALNESGGPDKVLWEWRPPYLPRRSQQQTSSIMAARPYTVLASLSADFKRLLEKELSSTLGDASQETVANLLTELGERGVGIASLLSMGHQHTRGAIGFFLGFKLASRWQHEAADGEIRLGLPLDAVNPIFETLAGDYNVDDRKKADLLFISACKNNNQGYSIDVIPVEVKMHAADNYQHKFPAGNSKEVKEALKQLKSSMTLLEAFTKNMNLLDRSALINVALSALIETGFSLSHSEMNIGAKERSLFLQSVADGSCEFRLAAGALFWFERGGHSVNGEPFVIRRKDEKDNAIKVYVDPEKCFEDLISKEDSGFIKKFIEFFDLSDVTSPTSSEEIIPVEAPLDLPKTPAPALGKSTQKYPLSHDVKALEETSIFSRVLSDEVLEERYLGILEALAAQGVICFRPVGDTSPYSEGPASVMYRLQPGPGVDTAKVRAKMDLLELELSLSKDQNIVIDRDMGLVTLDVPKRTHERCFIFAHIMWQSWTKPSCGLAVPLGADQNGSIISLNFSSSNTPHLLIGGTTGMGKSEALNTILYGMTHYYSSKELSLILVDPKGTELMGFENSPYLSGPIVCDDEGAIEVLGDAVVEMDHRYQLFTKERVRLLKDYNLKVSHDLRLPWMVIVIDEYADLTSDAGYKKEIEKHLKRLTQKARAVGIHIIIATQKPEARVISTNLRANMPAQLALKVKSGVESRVIMDDGGAESLGGMGDAYLKTVGKLDRLQCAWEKDWDKV